MTKEEAIKAMQTHRVRHRFFSKEESGTSMPRREGMKGFYGEQVQAGQDIKKQSLDNTGEASKPAQATSQSDSVSSSTKATAIAITNVPLQKKGGTLSVNTIIQKTNASGTCTLVISKSGQTSVTKTAPAQVSGSVATCAGFRNIDVSKLASGQWIVTVSYKDSISTGSTSETVGL